MNIVTLNKVLLNNTPLNYRRKRILTEKDFYFKTIERTFTFSKSAGGKSINDGTARMTELRGNSVVWNQCLKDIAAYSAEITDNGDTYTIVPNGVLPGLVSRNLVPKANHVYILLCTKIGGKQEPFNFNWGGFNKSFVNPIFTASDATKDSLYISCYQETETFKLTKPSLIDLTQMFGAGNEPTTIEEFYQRIPQNIDINAYNEGELISYKGEALKSVGFNAWDEEWEKGTYETSTGNAYASADAIRSKNRFKILGGQEYYTSAPTNNTFAHFYDEAGNLIKGVSGKYNYAEIGNKKWVSPFNAAYMTFYMIGQTTYNNDICINLAHTGYRNGEYEPYKEFTREIDPRIREAFADGMKSAGTASDKVYNKNGKGVIEKRIGVVDMGTLNWRAVMASNGTYNMASDDLESIANAVSINNIVGNILCAKFLTLSADDIYLQNAVESIAIGRTGRLTVYSTGYTTTDAVDSFKAAMAGVMLYYELAEPVITEYDEPFNLDYLVWDFGTEESQSSVPSAALLADVGYYFKKPEVKELTLN